MRKLDAFQYLKEPSYRGCIGKEKLHMVLHWQKGCQRRRLLFYTERILTLSFDKQFDISKDYLLFAKRINENWCLDLAFMDKFSEFNNGVKYLLIYVDVFLAWSVFNQGCQKMPLML